MSSSDAGKAMVPPADTLVATDRGLTAWRPAFDAITVDPLPGGLRSLKVTCDGRILYDRMLSCQEAAHLAALLTGWT